MSDPIEINKLYIDLGEAENFVSYARLAGGDSDPEDYEVADGNAKDRGGRVQAGEARKSEAEEILRQARQERERILAEEEELKKKAYEEGFASGQAEGRQEGREEYTGKITAAAGLINELGDARKRLVESYEAEILELVKVMVERLVQKEIENGNTVIREVLDDALEYIVENTTVTVKLNRADFESLSGSGEEDRILAKGRRRVELVEDNSISPGGCLVVTGSGEVDATLENRRDILFAAVDKALNG